MNITEFRKQHSEYDNRSDDELSRALHAKHYPQMDYDEFATRFMGFDPEGTGYDYATAGASGDTRDVTGHLGSIDPRTGMLLKGMKHETIGLAIEAERKRGNVIVKGEGGRYYSRPKQDVRARIAASAGLSRPSVPIKEAGQAIKEMAAAPVRTIESMVAGGVGGLIRMAAEKGQIGPRVAENVARLGRLTGKVPGDTVNVERLIRKYGFDKSYSFYDRKLKRLADSGKKIQDFWDEQANKGWEAPNPDIVEARWRDRPISKTVSAVSSGLTSIGVVVGTTALTGSPHVGLATLASSEAGSMYSRLRDEDTPVDVASKLALMAGAWTYVTEKVPFDRLMKPGIRSFTSALKQAGWEGAQEVIEGMGHNLLEYFGYDYRRPSDIPTAVKAATDHMMDNWIDSLVSGIGAGGLAHVALHRGKGPRKEVLAGAAIRLKSGEMLSGPTHANILREVQASGRVISNEEFDIPAGSGFLTNTGKFVSPEKAWEIADKADQIKKDEMAQELVDKKYLVAEGVKFYRPFEATVYRGVSGKTPVATGFAEGTHYTVNKKLAQSFAEDYGEGGRLIEKNIVLKNPYYITDDSVFGVEANKIIAEEEAKGQVYSEMERGDRRAVIMREILEKQGYDGIVYNEGEEVVAFARDKAETGEPIIAKPPTVEEITKKPIEEIEPQTPDHAIGHQYGIDNTGVDNRLDQAELRYRELKQKTVEERSAKEIDELAFLKRNRTNIEALLERETKPAALKIKRTQKNLLALGHKIARDAGLTDTEYRDLAEIVTGKRSMGKMTKIERNEFVSALEESYGAPKELTPEDYDIAVQLAGETTSMRKIYARSLDAVSELTNKKDIPSLVKIGFGKRKPLLALKNFFFGIDNTPPYHLARILDGGTEGIFSEVIDKNIEYGRKISKAHVRSVTTALLNSLEDAGVTNDDLAKMGKAVNPRLQTYQMVNKGSATETFIETINDQDYQMTMANLIDIYLISNQEAGMKHLTKGGLVIEGVETGALSEAKILDLRQRVDENPKAKTVVDTILEIGEQIWKPSINSVSSRLEGIDIATVEDWWGLEVYMPKKLAGKTRIAKLSKSDVNLLEDKGILKDRTRSTAPLVVRDAFSRFSVFENAIAEYTGMAEPARTSRTILNDPDIASALDQKGYSEIRDRILDIHSKAQGTPVSEGNLSAWFAQRLPALYRAVLFFNPRVVASQYTSVFNYGAYVSPEFMTGIKDGLSVENSLETLELSDIAWDRFHMGHSSLELGETVQADAALRVWTGGKSSDINKAGWAMKIADLGALTAGMEIAKKEYDAARANKLTGFSTEWWLDKDNLPEANSELYKKVQEEGENADPEERQAVEEWQQLITERAEYLWQRSQPSWDKWNRSTLTSQKGLRRIYLLFRSFHEKSLTIVNEAKLDYDNSAKTLDDKTKFAQKTGAVLTGYTINMFLRIAIMAAMTRQLKEPVKYFEEFLTSWMSMFPIFGKALKITVNRFVDTLAGAKTSYIGEVLESYPVRVVNMVLNSPADMAEAAAHTIMGEDDEAEEAFMRGIGRFAEGAGTLSGVPVPEIKRVLPKEEKAGRAPSKRKPAVRRAG